MMSRCAALGIGLAAFLAAGCATLNAPFDAHLASEAPLVRGCAEWFRTLDERVTAAGTRDAQDSAVRGFPYLRVSRLLAALRPVASSNEHALQALADRMFALDQEARRYEIVNLPTLMLPEWREGGDAGSDSAAGNLEGVVAPRGLHGQVVGRVRGIRATEKDRAAMRDKAQRAHAPAN